MYADRIETGTKPSIRERLNGNLDEDFGRSRPGNGKRKRQNDDKWKHDLYEDRGGPQIIKAKVGSEDLRLKLQKKSSPQAFQGGRELGVRDLREKLSGTMQSQPTDTVLRHLPKAKTASESAKPVKESVPSVEETLPETKKVSVSTSTKKSQKKTLQADLSVSGLLKSLGLEKYSITFQAEEVDMAALRHMTDKDLKTLGIPMGPRKKILSALESRA